MHHASSKTAQEAPDRAAIGAGLSNVTDPEAAVGASLLGPIA